MKYIPIFLALLILGCSSGKTEKVEQSNTEPDTSIQPLPYHPELVPRDQIVHRGIFSNDLKQYFMTVSNPDFTSFDILVSQQTDGQWAEPVEAIFNSEYDDHGMNFSPDGKTVFFSSKRPLIGKKESVWRIFSQKNTLDELSEPTLITVPNMQSKHLLHPSQAPNGTLYFQASNLDYSDLAIYYLAKGENEDRQAKRLEFESLREKDLCTPYVSADGRYLLFATVGPQLDLYLSKSTGNNQWSEPVKLPSVINQGSQGNPYLTPDNNYLFYAKTVAEANWQINWVNTATFIDEETP